MQSGIRECIWDDPDEEELDTTDRRDSDGVDGGEDCILESSSLFQFTEM